MYEALLAFLYAQGSRYGAHDLAEFLAQVPRMTRTTVAAAGSPPLEAEADQRRTERTPVEIPAARPTSSRARRRRASRHVGDRRAPRRWASGAR